MRVVGNPETFKLRLVVGLVLTFIASVLAGTLIFLIVLPKLPSFYNWATNKLPVSGTDCVFANGKLESGPESCKQYIQDSKSSIDFTSIIEGTNGDITARENVVITNQEELNKYWNELYALQSPIPTTPTVDFSTDEVILVTMGTQRSGGYSIEVTNVLRYSPQTIEVIMHEKTPDPTLGTIQVLTNPFHMIRIPKQTGEIVFTRLEDN